MLLQADKGDKPVAEVYRQHTPLRTRSTAGALAQVVQTPVKWPTSANSKENRTRYVRQN